MKLEGVSTIEYTVSNGLANLSAIFCLMAMQSLPKQSDLFNWGINGYWRTVRASRQNAGDGGGGEEPVMD